MYKLIFLIAIVAKLVAIISGYPSENLGVSGKSDSKFPEFLTSIDLENGKRYLEIYRDRESEELTSQWFSKEHVIRRDNNPNLRNAHRRRRWPGAIIPYVISPLYTETERTIVAAAIQEYLTKTCIKFVPRTYEYDFAYITPDDFKGKEVSTYCYSDVGKLGQGLQFVKMYGECVRLPAMIHELGHLIGFEHEHQRIDRDDYITLLDDNIDPVFKYAYNKVSDADYDTLGYPYDYKSVMHYHQYSFAKPGLLAFILKYPGNIKLENQRLSDLDVLKINKYYGCN